MCGFPTGLPYPHLPRCLCPTTRYFCLLLQAVCPLCSLLSFVYRFLPTRICLTPPPCFWYVVMCLFATPSVYFAHVCLSNIMPFSVWTQDSFVCICLLFWFYYTVPSPGHFHLFYILLFLHGGAVPFPLIHYILLDGDILFHVCEFIFVVFGMDILVDWFDWHFTTRGPFGIHSELAILLLPNNIYICVLLRYSFVGATPAFVTTVLVYSPLLLLPTGTSPYILY